MATRRKTPTGGVGSNQYQTRGASRARPSQARVEKFAPSATTEHDQYSDLLDEGLTAYHEHCRRLGIDPAAELTANRLDTGHSPAETALRALTGWDGTLGDLALSGKLADAPEHVWALAYEAAAHIQGVAAVGQLAIADGHPAWMADRLAASDVFEHRFFATRLPDLTEAAALRLADDPTDSVRDRLAGRPDLPESAMRRLAADDYWLVRCSLADNYDLPPELCAQLARDPNERVRQTVAANGNTPSKALDELAREPGNARYIIVHEFASAKTRARLALAGTPEVRHAAARYIHTPRRVLAKLAADPEESIAATAAETLAALDRTRR